MKVVDKTYECGLFGCRPKFLQKFSNKVCFTIVVFLISYFLNTPIISLIVHGYSLEYVFRINRTENFIRELATQAGVVSTFFMIPILITIRRRPLAMGVMGMICGISYILIALPNFLIDPKLYIRGDGFFEVLIASMVTNTSIPDNTCNNTQVSLHFTIVIVHLIFYTSLSPFILFYFIFQCVG